jgi:hypothetical protein
MLDWLFGKVKYFFWSSVVSGSLLVGASISPNFKNKMFSSLQTVHETAKAKTPKFIADRIPDLNLPKVAVQKVEETGVQKVSGSSNEYFYNNRHYVLIEGKYYEARSDNTYMINGRKVFYVSKREKDTQPETQTQAGSRAVDVKRTAASASANSEKIGIPTTPIEIVEAVKKAEKQLRERNRQLEELEKSF